MDEPPAQLDLPEVQRDVGEQRHAGELPLSRDKDDAEAKTRAAPVEERTTEVILARYSKLRAKHSREYFRAKKRESDAEEYRRLGERQEIEAVIKESTRKRGHQTDYGSIRETNWNGGWDNVTMAMEEDR